MLAQFKLVDDFDLQTLKEAIQNANNNEEKITYLKAAGNAGWTTKDVFKIVCDQLNNAKTLHHVRLQAIWALRQMARVKPTEVSHVIYNR